MVTGFNYRAIIAECHMYMVNRQAWKEYWRRKPEEIACENLQTWALRFEMLGVQYEPLLQDAFDILSWLA